MFFSKAALILHFHLVCFWVYILSAGKKHKKASFQKYELL